MAAHPRRRGAALLAAALLACTGDAPTAPGTPGFLDGQAIFRFDTFGDEVFWTDTLLMHEVIQVGVSPRTALSVGLKVDADALPPGLLEQADLDDPVTTVALLKLDAVVGLRGEVQTVDGGDTLTRVGITCALCHSTVDNSAAPGVGRRLDGWPNRDLDPGLILSLSPALQAAETQAVLKSWGPGKYDAYWNLDGISDPVLIPPAYGLAGVELETYTGEGPISYWNAYVAVTQMHGQGNFSDPRLGLDIRVANDQVTPKLAALRDYQHSLAAPPPPVGSYEPGAAARGRAVFEGRGRCAGCHAGPRLTDAGAALHDPAETGMDPLLASRGTTGRYRTTPLRALWQHPPYFHDGSAATLEAVVDHYDRVLDLGLSELERSDLVQYLRSL